MKTGQQAVEFSNVISIEKSQCLKVQRDILSCNKEGPTIKMSTTHKRLPVTTNFSCALYLIADTFR